MISATRTTNSGLGFEWITLATAVLAALGPSSETPAPAPVPPPPEPKTSPWVVGGAIVGGVAVLGILAVVLMRR